MKISKKIISFIVASMFLLNINLLNIEAEVTYEYSSDDLFTDQDNIQLSNVEMKQNQMNIKSICVKNIENVYGECIFKIPNIQKVNVVFYNELCTAAFKAKNSHNYTLGYSQEDYDNLNQNNPLIVKYLPDNVGLDDLQGGLFIKNQKTWYRLLNPNQDYIEQYTFQPLDTQLTNLMRNHKSNLIDFGVNIYTSPDGIKFKKLKVKLSIEKLSKTISSVPFISLSIYKETITSNNLPRGTQYIKIQINEPKLFTQQNSPNNLTFISDISFTVSENDDEQLNDDSLPDILGYSNNTSSHRPFGCSDFMNKGKSRRKSNKNLHSINNEVYEFSNILGNSSNYMSDNMVIGCSDNNVEHKITRLYKPIKSKKPIKERKIIYKDGYKSKKPLPKRNKTPKMNFDNNQKEYDNIKPLSSDMDYKSSGFIFDDENLDHEHTKKVKSKTDKDIDPITTNSKMKNKSSKYNIAQNDEDYLNTFENVNDESSQSAEEYLKTDEKESDIDKNVEEKKVSKIYLSGLCLILSYLFAYNKIGLLQKLFKL